MKTNFSFIKGEKGLLWIGVIFSFLFLLAPHFIEKLNFLQDKNNLLQILFFTIITLTLVICLTLLLYPYFKNMGVKILGFVVVFFLAVGVNWYYFIEISDTAEKTNFFTILLGTINNSLSIFFPSRGDYLLKEKGPHGFLILYYVSHLLAYAYFALLAISLINAGRRMMNQSRSLFVRNNQYVFAGYNEASFLLAKDLIKNKNDIHILFFLPYSEINNHALFEKLDSLGFIVKYVPLDGSNMNKISCSNMKKSCACFFLDDNEDVNIKLALKFIRRLEEINLQKDLEMFVRVETEDMELLFDNKLANLHIHIFNQSDITARQFVIDHPMLKAPETACAENNILILGFGYMGKELLKKTIGDVQYSKKRLSITVIDECFETRCSDFLFRCAEAVEAYNVVFNPGGVSCVRSKAFFEWLLAKREKGDVSNLLSFNRIFVALGNSRLNIDVAQTICNLRRNYELANSKDVIFAHINEIGAYDYFSEQHNDRSITTFGNPDKIYTVDVVICEAIDAIAKAMNHLYVKENEAKKDAGDKTKNENITENEAWNRAPLYNQNSSRAAAAGLWNVALLTGHQLAKIPKDQRIAKEEIKQIIEDNIEEFAEYEHLRWNAYLRLNGVSRWNYKEIGERETKTRLEMNGKVVKHLCLVEYDELDIISELITKNSGKKVDYKEYDRQNVRQVFSVLGGTEYWFGM